MKYDNIREEELKNKVARDFFKSFDTTEILGNIDFTVSPNQSNLFEHAPILWAEAKKGDFEISTMFVQLVLTIGKARTFDKTTPPPFLGVFDFKKIAFIKYVDIEDIFYINDFNWNIAPSNHDSKEFKLIFDRIKSIIKDKIYVFDYLKDEKRLNFFIKNNLAKGTTKAKIKIHKNNFIPIYLRWLDVIKPIIEVNWEELSKKNILDSDFFLADLFVDDNDTQDTDDDMSLRNSLFVVYKSSGYKINKENLKQIFDASINIKNIATYTQFWKLYKRPPIDDCQDYIIERRDLLVPQDVRERKGAFFTPREWVELSQKYMTKHLGKNWQDEYYIWDCAAGTGNLLAGLTNKYNVYASTIDQADINVVYERIDNGANLLKKHVFQFDFLNDDFSKIPESLQKIIYDNEKRKKLIIYINPPYAEASSSKTVSGTGKNKAGVSTSYKVKEKLNPIIGSASNELFTLFMAIIYEKIPGCILGQFSKLKFINGTNFRKFKDFFKAEYMGGFVVPAETFDNVKGKFPIGFTIWDTSIKSSIDNISADIFDKKGNYIGNKKIYGNLPKSINKWFIKYRNNRANHVGLLSNYPPDFQNQAKVFITKGEMARGGAIKIISQNLIPISIYLSVRHCIKADWLNDRDQFLYPNDEWQDDLEFQSNCLANVLFHGQNRVSCSQGVNHWIPFTEQEVESQEKFESNFMSRFIKGEIENEGDKDLFENKYVKGLPIQFSIEAQDVFTAGRNLWKYYHKQLNIDVNASFYDIRKHFQGTNSAGRMNSKSSDEKYTELIIQLKNKMNFLVDKIKPKVFEYGFLKK